MDLIERVVDYVLSVSYRDLTQETVDAVKKSMIDVMGAAVAGSSAEGIGALVNLVRGWAGKPEATILVYGGKIPAFQAALANCAMARAWDIDDVHEPGGGHLSASVIPTAFILAEHAQKKVTGRDLILASAIGTDLACRLRLAMKKQFGWVIETFAPFGIVAEASRLLGFDREMTRDAMGLAYTQCSCNSQGVVDGVLSVRLQQGIGAKAGVLATQFAQIGFTGPRNVLEGVYGLYPLYARNEYDPGVITDELGKRFEIVNASIKPYPCCKHTHIPIFTTIELLKEHGIKPQEITKILVRTNQAAYDKCFSSPTKRHPQSVAHAQFSIPFTVALAAIKGGVSLRDFCETNWKDPSLQSLAEKVEVVVDAELTRQGGMIAPNRIELETRNGRRYTKRVDFVKGSPHEPMSLEDCIEKFNDCVTFAAKPIDRRKLSEFVAMARDLEDVEDVRPMVELLVA
jgi:2-methylcitrate dehydratase PrpD